MNKTIIIAIALISAFTGTCIAGNYTLTTTPTYTYSSNNQNYFIPISKDDAANGVIFNAGATATNGTITSWDWVFTNGTPSTYSGQTPPTVTFGSAAYGVSNNCDGEFTHNGNNGSGTCSNPSIPIAVNVIKPQLVFSFSWSSNDTLQTSVFPSHVATLAVPPPTGVVTAYTLSGSAYHGTAYEYQVTALPASSGATSSDLSIHELGAAVYVAFVGTSQVSLGSASGDSYYDSGNWNVLATVPPGYNPTEPPINPILYAADMPGPSDSLLESYLNTYPTATKIVDTITLTSTPLYQRSTTTPDTSLNQSCTLPVVIRTSGGGNYAWSNN